MTENKANFGNKRRMKGRLTCLVNTKKIKRILKIKNRNKAKLFNKNEI